MSQINETGPRDNKMTLWQQRKELMKDRVFLIFMLHAFVTLAGGAMCYIVLTWHVMNLPNSHALIYSLMISISFWMPSVLLSPLAGVIVDRYPRKNLIMITNCLRAFSFLSIGLLLMHKDTIWFCCLLSLINGTIFTILGPAAMAFVREIVPNDKLLAANSTIDLIVESANIIGFGLAGVLITMASTSHSLFIIASCIGIAALMLLFIQQKSEDQHHIRNKSTPWREFNEGLSYLGERPMLMLLYALNAVIFIQTMISPILLAPFIKTVLHGTGHDFSTVELSLCFGIVFGCFLIPWFAEKYGRIRCLFVSIIWISTVFFLMSISHSVNAMILLYGLLGLFFPIWSVIASYSQEMTDKSMQGRTQATCNTLTSFIMMLVYIGLGVNSIHMSIAHTYWVCTGLGTVALAILYRINILEKAKTAEAYQVA